MVGLGLFVCGLSYFIVVLVLEGIRCGFCVLGLFAMGSLLYGFGVGCCGLFMRLWFTCELFGVLSCWLLGVGVVC